jgi:hypothetical protein
MPLMTITNGGQPAMNNTNDFHQRWPKLGEGGLELAVMNFL